MTTENITGDGLDGLRVSKYLSTEYDIQDDRGFMLSEQRGFLEVVEWKYSVPVPDLAALRTRYVLKSADACLVEVRIIRDRMLQLTDFMFLTDAPVREQDREIRAFRQALRDLPTTIQNAGLASPVLMPACLALFPLVPRTIAPILRKEFPFLLPSSSK